MMKKGLERVFNSKNEKEGCQSRSFILYLLRLNILINITVIFFKDF